MEIAAPSSPWTGSKTLGLLSAPRTLRLRLLADPPLNGNAIEVKTAQRVDEPVQCGHIPDMDESDFGFAPPFCTLAPDDCATMTDVRAGVDEIDRMLVVLLARRQGYMDAAARIKPLRAQVRDEARIQQVLDNVAANSVRAGLSWAIAEPVWRTLMERCIAHEFMVYDDLKPGGNPGDGV